MSQLYKELSFPVHGGNDGSLIALEEQSELIPFAIKRIYYIYDVADSLRRGFHAHKTLRQVLISVRGQCELLLDNGSIRETITLDSPAKGIAIERPLWREMFDFSEDCVLLVLASEFYDQDDYIRNYKDFQNFIRTENV